MDPNEMVGPEGTGEQRYVKPGEWMNYTIYFENKADAEAAAQEIWIDNELSQRLDWSTFEMGVVSLAGQIDYGLVGLSLADLAISGGAAASEIDQTNGLYKARTEVQFDAATGLASWYIRVVDAAKRAAGDGECWPDDPDAGVLNPNVTVPEGEGYITYRVRVREDAPGNARIDNSATIVFDYNDPIVTDPAWWNTVYEIATVPVTIDGVTTNMPFVVGEPYGELPTPRLKPGYTFAGWWTGPNGTGRRVTPETIVQSGDHLYANWVKNADPEPVWTVTFDANGGTLDGAATVNVTNGQSIGEMPLPVRDHFAFLGWFTQKSGGEQVIATTVVSSDMTLYAHWGAVPYLYETVSESAPTAAASEYNGYLVDAKGAVAGTFQLKVGKANAKTNLAAVKATVLPAGGKKVSLKGPENGKAAVSADGPTTIALSGGEACTVMFGGDGLSGTYGAFAIKGARNFFTSKEKTEVKAAEEVLAKWLGPVNVVWGGGSATVTLAKKGKVKVTGTLADGKTKVSANAVFLVGEAWCAVPVLASKANLAFILWLPIDGREVQVAGLGADVLVGAPGSLGAGSAFRLDKEAALWGQIAGTVMTDFLPDGVSVTQSGKKWVLPKAGKIAMKKGVLDDAKAGENPAGLKLTCKAKDGSFKGSFKVYSESDGKLKATTVNVTGVMVNGKGYGTASIKKVGSVPIRIE